MNDHLRLTARLIALLLGVLAVALALTGVYLIDFRSDCHDDGGHFSVDGATAWCRY
jgi:hypothetical protein